jgi:hypothetical protein
LTHLGVLALPLAPEEFAIKCTGYRPTGSSERGVLALPVGLDRRDGKHLDLSPGLLFPDEPSRQDTRIVHHQQVSLVEVVR